MKHLFPYINLENVQFPEVQHHLNGIDCGVYAIAFNVSLLFGLKPNTIKYDLNKMRSHLIKMFDTMQIEHFPQDSRSTVIKTVSLAVASQRHHHALAKRSNRTFTSKKKKKKTIIFNIIF